MNGIMPNLAFDLIMQFCIVGFYMVFGLWLGIRSKFWHLTLPANLKEAGERSLFQNSRNHYVAIKLAIYAVSIALMVAIMLAQPQLLIVRENVLPSTEQFWAYLLATLVIPLGLSLLLFLCLQTVHNKVSAVQPLYKPKSLLRYGLAANTMLILAFWTASLMQTLQLPTHQLINIDLLRDLLKVTTALSTVPLQILCISMIVYDPSKEAFKAKKYSRSNC